MPKIHKVKVTVKIQYKVKISSGMWQRIQISSWEKVVDKGDGTQQQDG